MASPVQSLEISYLVHATEDQDRISSAVKTTLEIRTAPATEELEGHFGNKILHVSYRLTGEEASSAFASLARNLPKSARKELFENLGGNLDEHSTLYLRLDRQSLVGGRLAFGGAESVRLRVKPRLFLMKGGALDFFRRALGEGT